MGDDGEKAWVLYAEAASSLTRLYQHSSAQKRETYNAGYKAALESVLQFAVKQCSEKQTNTVCAASLINFILPQLQREAMQGADRDGRMPAHAPTASSPAAAQRGAQARGLGASPCAGGYYAPTCDLSQAASHAPADVGSSGHADESHLAWLAPPAHNALAIAAQTAAGAGPARKRSAEALGADWMMDGAGSFGLHSAAAGVGAMQPFADLLPISELGRRTEPPEWPAVWQKRGRH